MYRVLRARARTAVTTGGTLNEFRALTISVGLTDIKKAIDIITIESNLIVMNRPRDKSNPFDAWNKDHLFRKVQRGNAKSTIGTKFLNLERTDAGELMRDSISVDEASINIRE
jgi:hypothetical protein